MALGYREGVVWERLWVCYSCWGRFWLDGGYTQGSKLTCTICSGDLVRLRKRGRWSVAQ